jgi:hypothetical protein
MNMKRKAIGSLLLSSIFLVSMSVLPARSHAQPRARFRADTGVVTLGLGQVLRITISSEGFEDGNPVRVRFAWMKYMLASCNTEGVCRHTIQSQGVTAPVNVPPNEAASFDVQGTGGGVRVGVFVATGDVTGDAVIINTATGEVVSHVIMANTEGDFH